MADLDHFAGVDGPFVDIYPPAPCTLVAVGWLDRALPSAPGNSVDLLPVARKLAACWRAAPDLIGHEMGRHGCGLCGHLQNRAPATVVTLDGAELGLGEGYIVVPANSAVFVSPSLVIHYILLAVLLSPIIVV